MSPLKFSILLLLASLFTLTINAQTESAEPNLSLDEGTIDNQFEYIIRNSNRYQDYKVVKTNWLITLKAHTLDSIKVLQDQLDGTKKVINTQQNEIDELKTNLTTTQGSLSDSISEKNSMSLLGLQMSKTGYNMLMWSIIAGLLVFLLLFIFKFRNSNSVTKSAKLALSEIEEEFEEHRRNALEREQKVRRQLQDELNKQKGTS